MLQHFKLPQTAASKSGQITAIRLNIEGMLCRMRSAATRREPRRRTGGRFQASPQPCEEVGIFSRRMKNAAGGRGAAATVPRPRALRVAADGSSADGTHALASATVRARSGTPDSWAGSWAQPGGIDQHKGRQTGDLRSSELSSTCPQKARFRVASSTVSWHWRPWIKLPQSANQCHSLGMLGVTPTIL
jgi:hypothetical protein